jgi:hypothetical protein
MEPIGINNYMNIQFDEMVKQIERLGGNTLDSKER